MERIQGRATKKVFELRNLSENDRLTALGLTTLEVRRKKLDLIQLFKIINEFEDVDIGIGMGNNMIEGGGRRHGFQILKERARISFAKSKRNYLEYTTLRGSEC